MELIIKQLQILPPNDFRVESLRKFMINDSPIRKVTAHTIRYFFKGNNIKFETSTGIIYGFNYSFFSSNGRLIGTASSLNKHIIKYLTINTLYSDVEFFLNSDYLDSKFLVALKKYGNIRINSLTDYCFNLFCNSSINLGSSNHDVEELATIYLQDKFGDIENLDLFREESSDQAPLAHPRIDEVFAHPDIQEVTITEGAGIIAEMNTNGITMALRTTEIVREDLPF